jgi:dTDP-4-amino-4,6-dideoxygalactose transaminase
MRPQLPSASQVSPWLKDMDECRIYSNFGPLAKELEAAYAGWLNVPTPNVVSVTNATMGIQGAVSVSQAHTWIVPDFTFPATAHAVVASGKGLELRDVHSADWQLDPSEIRDRAVQNGFGVIPVMPFGAPVLLEKWRHFENVVIDAAASLGAGGLDLAQMPRTWAVVFSLHATKVLPAGEGGIVAFGSSAQADRFRAWSNFGFMGTRSAQLPATNAKMSEISAAYGLASLHGWDQEQHERREMLAVAAEISKDLEMDCPVTAYPGVHPYWIVNFADSVQCQSVAQALSSVGIETRKWWPQPLSEMPAFERYRTSLSSNASSIAESTLGLPMYRGLSESDLRRIARYIEASLTSAEPEDTSFIRGPNSLGGSTAP